MRACIVGAGVAGAVAVAACIGAGVVAAAAAAGACYLHTSITPAVHAFAVATCSHPDMASIHSSLQALVSVVRRSTATTMMGLEKDLKVAAAQLERQAPMNLTDRI